VYDLVYDQSAPRAAAATAANSIVFRDDIVIDKPATVGNGAANLGSATLDATAPNILGTFRSSGGGTISGSPLSADPGLGAFGFNGGPGMATFPLSAGGKALKKGASCPAADERGVTRPAGLCDLGAFQRTGANVKFGKLKRNNGKGTGTLVVKVKPPGKLTVTGKGLTTVKRSAKRKTIKVPVKARGKAKRKLNSSGRAKLKLAASFTFANGTVGTGTKRVKLVKR
jgi:hypothetical protein